MPLHARAGAMALVLAVSITAPVRGQLSVDIPADRDNTLYEDALGTLSNGQGDFFFAGRTDAITNFILRRSLIRFDIAATIPDGATVTGAELRLHLTRTLAGTHTVALHRLASNWGESTSNAAGQEGGGTAAVPGDATWVHTFTPDSLWSTPGGDFDPSPSAAQSVGTIGLYTWSSTELVADVQDMLDRPDANFGWAILGNEAANGSAKRFASRENINASLRPVLFVEYSTGAGPCAILATGDVNIDGARTSSDIIFLVNYVFKGGAAPQPCIAAGDVNCDGGIASSDIISLVNFVFKAGPPPCDVCTLIPETWTCP